MADGVIKVSVSANKKNSVTVSSNKNNTEITATADAGRFWAQTAKNWAVSDVLVDNTDYSAKYYAQQSSMSENNAKNHAETTQQIYNQFLDVVDTSTNNFLSTKEEALEDLENAKTETLSTIQAKSNEGVESIENEANNSLEELISLKSSTLNEVNNTKIEATSSITTLSNDYISQINTTGKSYNTLTNKQITNCILEIPQRVKYTLENGTLTIKAGSVVIVPYGTEDLTAQHPVGSVFINDNFRVFDTQFEDGKFFVWAEVQSDISSDTKETTIFDRFVGLCINRNEYTRNNYVSSGTGDATGNWFVHYSTDKNIVMTTNGSGEIIQTQYGTTSLPFLIATGDGVNSYGSIKQVFNGFGYIGSTVWCDKGVKGLIPNGRNEDGTLNNIEYASDRIFMRTFNSTVADSNLEELIFCPFDSSFPYFTGSALKGNYITNDGFLYNKNTDSILKGFSICSISRKSGKITEIIPKQPFRAVDYSDSSTVGGWGMPSGKCINLTLGASGAEYTAPANGWIIFQAKATSTDAWMSIRNRHWYDNRYCSDNLQYFGLTAPVLKGDPVFIDYRNLSVLAFRFIYAQGEV